MANTNDDSGLDDSFDSVNELLEDDPENLPEPEVPAFQPSSSSCIFGDWLLPSILVKYGMDVDCNWKNCKKCKHCVIM